MFSKLVTNKWINEKGTIPLQPSAKVINIFQGKRRAPAVTEDSKKGRRKRNGLSIANIVIYNQNQKCLWDQHAHLSSQRQTYRGSPIKRMRLPDEFRIQNQGRWLCTWNVPWPSASTAGCICLPNRDSLVDGAFIFTSYWLISNLFKDCQETLINLAGAWRGGEGCMELAVPSSYPFSIGLGATSVFKRDGLDEWEWRCNGGGREGRLAYTWGRKLGPSFQLSGRRGGVRRNEERKIRTGHY